MHNLDRDFSFDEIKAELSDSIDAYLRERIAFPQKIIAQHALKKLKDEEEVLLVYGRSEAVSSVLCAAHAAKKKFRVVVVDARPHREGRETLRFLLSLDGFDGSLVTYVMLNSLSHVMREVTKVFLGAACLMGDGSVMGRVGTASVALMARSFNVPVLFCCETYKICDRVRLESITSNELGDPDEFLVTNDSMNNIESGKRKNRNCSLTDWKKVKNLKLIHLKYDLTLSEFVSGIITEMGIIPPTSVMVLLREMSQKENA